MNRLGLLKIRMPQKTKKTSNNDIRSKKETTCGIIVDNPIVQGRGSL